MRQGLADEGALEGLGQRVHDARLTTRQHAVGFPAKRSLPVRITTGDRSVTQLRRQIADLDHLGRRHHGQPMTDVLQLAHIAGKILRVEIGHGSIGQTLGLDSQLFG